MSEWIRAAIYLRISDDREGRELGVTRQEEDCRKLCAREGFDVVDVFKDNDIGASTRTRKGKKRPGYDAVIAAAESGEVGAIVAYSNSRLTRRPMELEGLIQLHERTGVRLVTVASGEDDLAKADGRMVARIKSNIDAAESERLAERLTRRHLQSAQNGKTVGGMRPFGWQRGNRKLDPVESALLREAVDAVLKGIPLRRIVAEWNDRGIRTPFGKPWNRSVLSRILRSPRLAGWRIYRDKIATDENGQPVRGDFEPLLDQATFDRVVAALTIPDNRTRKPRRGARHYLLSGIVRCGICSAPMYGARRPYKTGGETREAHYYVCGGHDGARHTVTGSGKALDTIVQDAVAEDLERRRVETAKPTPFAGDERLGQIGGQITELMSAYRSGVLSGAIVFGQIELLEAEQAELQSARRRYEVDLATAFVSVDVTPEEFIAKDVDQRRATIEKRVAAVLLAPTQQRGNKFDTDRVQIVWR